MATGLGIAFANQFPHGPACEQVRQSVRTPAGIVGHDGEVARAARQQPRQQFARLADDAEAADKDHRAVLDPLQSLGNACNALIYHAGLLARSTRLQNKEETMAGPDPAIQLFQCTDIGLT